MSLGKVFNHENLGYEIELPEDTTTWTAEINKILFSSFPELANFPAKLVVDKFEPQKLYAKGSFVVDINGTKLVIPVMIKSKKLQPFDVAMMDEEWHYLNEEFIADLINGNLSLGEPMENKDSVDFYSQAIMNDVPYYSGNRNTRVITASVITPEDQKALAETYMNDKGIQKQAAENTAFANVISKVLKHTPRNYKAAFVTRDCMLNGHIYLTKHDGTRKKISTTFAEAKNFVKENLPEQYVDFIKTGSTEIVNDENAGSGSMSMDGMGSLLSKILSKVSNPGMHSVLNSNGAKPMLVIKIKKLMSGNDDLMGLTEGGMAHDVSDVEAAPSEEAEEPIMNSMEEAQPEEMKEGDEVLPQENGDFLEPITVHKVMEAPFGKAVIGETKADGDTFVGIILSKFRKDKVANNAGDILPKDGITHIFNGEPKFFKIATEHEDTFFANKKECLASMEVKTNKLKVYSRGRNNYAVKSASEVINCGSQALPYFLNSFGVGKRDIEDTIKVANESGVATVLTPIVKKASDIISNDTIAKIKNIGWLKIAAYMDSEESIDSALSLDYLDEGTVSEFYDQIPVYKKALSEMAKMMVSVRLGNSMVDEVTLKEAMESLSTLIHELTTYREDI